MTDEEVAQFTAEIKEDRERFIVQHIDPQMAAAALAEKEV